MKRSSSDPDSDGESNSKHGKFRKFVPIFVFQNTFDSSSIININDISDKYGHEKRRLYELFSVLCSFNVFSRTGNQRYKWNGIFEIENTIRKICIDIEERSENSPVSKLFEIGDSPSLSALSMKFVEIMLYFNGQPINFVEIAALMSYNTAKMKQISRRLYPTTSFLEDLRIIQHSSENSSYTLVSRLQNIPFTLLTNPESRKNIKKDSVLYLLNKVDSSFLNTRYTHRRQKLVEELKNKHKTVDFCDTLV